MCCGHTNRSKQTTVMHAGWAEHLLRGAAGLPGSLFEVGFAPYFMVSIFLTVLAANAKGLGIRFFADWQEEGAAVRMTEDAGLEMQGRYTSQLGRAANLLLLQRCCMRQSGGRVFAGHLVRMAAQTDSPQLCMHLLFKHPQAHHVVSNKSYCLPIKICILSLVLQGRANLDRLSRFLTAVVGFLMVSRTCRTYHLKRRAMALMRGLSRISPSSASGACAAPWLQKTSLQGLQRGLLTCSPFRACPACNEPSTIECVVQYPFRLQTARQYLQHVVAVAAGQQRASVLHTATCLTEEHLINRFDSCATGAAHGAAVPAPRRGGGGAATRLSAADGCVPDGGHRGAHLAVRRRQGQGHQRRLLTAVWPEHRRR